MADLNDLVVFTRVAQLGSFTAAARALRIPKSSVSRKVSTLEDRIGVRLLQRTTRKLGLTDAGRVYFEHGVRVVAELEEAELAVGRMRGAPCGRLRVTAPLSFSFLGGLVGEFLLENPAVELELVCTDRTMDLVGEGFDLAVRAGPMQDSALIARPLGELIRVLVATPGYLRKHGEPKRPSDLADHACLSFGGGGAPASFDLQSDDGVVEVVQVTSRCIANDFELLREACSTGVGIAFMPAFVCATELGRGTLRRVLPAHRSTPAPLHAVYPSTRHLSPKVTAFVALLQRRLALSLPRHPPTRRRPSR